jgi:hypothetical protein
MVFGLQRDPCHRPGGLCKNVTYSDLSDVQGKLLAGCKCQCMKRRGEVTSKGGAFMGGAKLTDLDHLLLDIDLVSFSLISIKGGLD